MDDALSRFFMYMVSLFFLAYLQEGKTIVYSKNQTKRKNEKYKTETNLHPAFTSIKKAYGGMLHIESIVMKPCL